jgi:probable aminopeptidase NPEPL1
LAELSYPATLEKALKGADTVLLLAPQKQWRAGWLEKVVKAPWRRLVERAAKESEAGAKGTTIATLNPDGLPRKVVLAVLPDRVSRHNSPTRGEAAFAAATSACLNGKGGAVIACLEDPAHGLATALAVARALPRFTRQTATKEDGKRTVAYFAADPKGVAVPLSAEDRLVVERVRWAAELVDTPTSELSTADFEKAVRKAAKGIRHVRVTAIQGQDLLAKGLGGIHAVGRCAHVPPRLVLVEYRPPGAKSKVGIVGKGIVYDTGGLSLKPTAGMSSMKCDMAGAAAAVAATLVLAEARAPVEVVCAAPLAENAIGPNAYRNDDILRLHSGKTVEINNTDAEGRLLLADAVSYVARKHEPDFVIDMATLTGAQPVATGIRHAAVVSNREGLEALAIRVGRETGDLTFPLPFAPEFYQDEFKSKVADMKNSVGNRSNAQSSCAAQFVYSHIEDLDLPWLHVDLAGPAFRDERGTGFGVALAAAVARSATKSSLSS